MLTQARGHARYPSYKLEWSGLTSEGDELMLLDKVLRRTNVAIYGSRVLNV